MNLYGQDKRGRDESEVNMTAVMNIFLILIPFLLLTAVFAKIAVLEISLPTGSGGGGAGVTPPEKSVLFIIVVTRIGDIQIKSSTPEMQFDRIYAKGDEQYDYDKLVEQLKTLKERYPWLEELVLQPDENVKYDVIVKIMDRCREQGFPNISLA